MIDDDNTKSSDYPRTLQSIADEMGISRQAVADIEKRALMKCRKIIRMTSMIESSDILPD